MSPCPVFERALLAISPLGSSKAAVGGGGAGRGMHPHPNGEDVVGGTGGSGWVEKRPGVDAVGAAE